MKYKPEYRTNEGRKVVKLINGDGEALLKVINAFDVATAYDMSGKLIGRWEATENEIAEYNATAAYEEEREKVMKSYYMVSFEYAEDVYCTNVAHAETAADVEVYYSKYAWQKVRLAAEYEVEEAKRKGMPVVEIAHVEPEATEATEATEAEPAAKPAKKAAKKAAKPAKKAYLTVDVMKEYVAELNRQKAEIAAGRKLSVSISNANSKMGAVASVSMLPGITCPASCLGTCGADCYAAKIANLRPSVRKSYAHNTALLELRPDVYWAGVEAAVMAVRYFRFHVGGDITGRRYFDYIAEIAKRNPKTEILVFTKRYHAVNSWISDNGELPSNLHVLFSGWEGVKPINPYNLPETNVFPRGGEPEEGWKVCGGNCFECACRGVGCWQAKAGDVIAFEKH